MKTILKLIFALFFIAGGLQAQVTLYNQNFNDSSASLPANWTNIGACNWVSNNTNQSTGYANSSGGRNLWANCNGNSEITVSNIVTTGYSNITIIFGARKGATQLNNLELFWSDDGVNYNSNPITYTDVTNNDTWALVNGGVAITLPAGCGNQANLRFKFRINNSGNPADYRLDDFKVTGIAPPTKLHITNVIGSQCSSPQVGIPFSVTVQSRDINNNPANVTSATNIQLTSTPSGIITGTPSGTIAINTSSVTISGVVYNTAGAITITATPTSGMTGLTPYTTGTINVRALPTGLDFSNLQITGIVNNVHPSFQVRATPLDSSSACFNGQVTLVQVSGPAGGMTGTVVVNASGGQATFSNVIFTQVGVYQIKATASGLTDAPTTTITIGTAPVAFTQLILPLYMQGKSGTNNERIHTAFLGEISNLVPNQIYRYYTRAVSTVDNVTEVGNSVFANTSGNFTRSSSPSLSSAGNYGIFTADAFGKFRGWFMLEPTGDTRFAAGQDIKCRIVVDGGNNGVATYTFTSTQTIKCLTFGTNAVSTEGSALFLPTGTAGTQAKNFLLFYRGDTSGTGGRPVAINVIESDGMDLTAIPEYFAPYKTSVDNQLRACGVIIPNILPAGITTITERSLVGGVLMEIEDSPGDVVSTANSPSGIWPPGVSTINPNNGTTPISIQPGFNLVAITQNSGVSSEYKLSQNYPNPFNPATKIDFSLPNSSNVELKIYDVLGREVYALLNEEFAAGNYSVDFNATDLPSGMYFYKLVSGNFSEVKKMVLIK